MPICRNFTSGETLPDRFPLSIHSSKRYLIDSQGDPWLPIIESAWSAITMLTQPQMDAFLTDCVLRGINAVEVQAIGKFTDHSPIYANAYGENPFNVMTDFADPNSAYFARVLYFVSKAYSLGILVFLWPIYSGFSATEGFRAEADAETTTGLNTYGQYLATLLIDYQNVIYCAQGDDSDVTRTERQFNVMRGVMAVNTTALFSAHGGRSSNAYSVLSAQLGEITGRLLNGIYTNDYEEYSAAATEYGRAGPIPFVDLDHQYENYAGHTADYTMLGQYVSMFSGACGVMVGSIPLCEFGAGIFYSAVGVRSVLTNYLATDAVVRTTYFVNLITAYSWWKLVPKTDASLVSTSLGVGSGRVAPALASDGAFAMIWSPGVNVTVVMTNFTPSSVQARLYDPTTGTFSAVAGSPFANTGNQSITISSTRILVMEAA